MSTPPPERLPDPGERYDRRWAETLTEKLGQWFDRNWNGDHEVKAKLRTSSGRILKGRTVTGASDTILLTDDIIGVNRAGVVALTLPLNPATWQRWYVQDDSGAASSNNITINKSAAKDVNGGASVVISTDYARLMIVYNGTEFIAH